jgi:hypothetical protein
MIPEPSPFRLRVTRRKYFRPAAERAVQRFGKLSRGLYQRRRLSITGTLLRSRFELHIIDLLRLPADCRALLSESAR